MSLEERLPSVLLVGCCLSGSSDDVTVTVSTTAREMLLAIRSMPIDVLLTGRMLGEEPIWPAIERFRRVRPKLPWWLVAAGICPNEEIIARTLGVTRILGVGPTALHIRDAFATCDVRSSEEDSMSPVASSSGSRSHS